MLPYLPERRFVPVSRVGENPATNRSDRHRSGVIHICVDLQDSSVTEMFIMVVFVVVGVFITAISCLILPVDVWGNNLG